MLTVFLNKDLQLNGSEWILIFSKNLTKSLIEKPQKNKNVRLISFGDMF